MNTTELNLAAASNDIRVDSGTNFMGSMTIKTNLILEDLTYWEAEFIIFWDRDNFPKPPKSLKTWSLTSGNLLNPSVGLITWDILIDLDPAEYAYYFKVQDANGDIFKYMKGKFIVE